MTPFVASLLAAVAVLLLPYLLYRVARWARAQHTGAYVLGAALAPIIAGGSVVDPDSRIVNEAKQSKESEEDDPGDPPREPDAPI
jgi:hypothetical protein